MPRTARSLVALAVLYLLGSVPADPSVASDLPRFGLQHQVGETPGFEENFTRLHGFVPLYGETDDWLLFGDLLGSIDNRSGVSSSAGLGLRIAPGSRGSVFGIHTHFDYREFEFAGGDHDFHRWGIGVEALGEFWAARGNAYVNASGRRSNGTVVNHETRFIDRYLLLGTAQNSFADSFHGVDFEISRLVPRPFGLPSDHEIGAGAYYWDTPHSDGHHAPGVKGRVHTWLTDSLVTYVHAAHDRVFDTSVNAGFIWYFGGPSTRPSERIASLAARMATPVQRQYEIPVLQYLEDAPALSVFATNPETGQRLTLTHVDDDAAPGGVGTWEQPFSRLEPASFSGTDIVLVQNGTYSSDFVSLSAGQRLLAAGTAHFVDTVERGVIQLPGTGLGGSSMILNAPADAITLATDTEVTGFTISGAGRNGVFGMHTTNVVLRSNTVLNSRERGIFLPNLFGTAAITGNVTSRNGDRGIEVQGHMTGDVVGNTSNENMADGIFVSGRLDGSMLGNTANENGPNGGGAGIVIGTDGISGSVVGNTANRNAVHGIFVQTFDMERAIGGELAGNTANGNGHRGIDILSLGPRGGVGGNVSGNTAHENGNDGIAIGGGASARIDGSLASNSADGNGILNPNHDTSGILVRLGLGIAGDVTGNIAHGNRGGITINIFGPGADFAGNVVNNVTTDNARDGFILLVADDFTGNFTGNSSHLNDRYGFNTTAGGTVTGTTTGNHANANGLAGFNGNIAQP